MKNFCKPDYSELNYESLTGWIGPKEERSIRQKISLMKNKGEGLGSEKINRERGSRRSQSRKYSLKVNKRSKQSENGIFTSVIQKHFGELIQEKKPEYFPEDQKILKRSFIDELADSELNNFKDFEVYEYPTEQNFKLKCFKDSEFESKGEDREQSFNSSQQQKSALWQAFSLEYTIRNKRLSVSETQSSKTIREKAVDNERKMNNYLFMEAIRDYSIKNQSSLVMVEETVSEPEHWKKTSIGKTIKSRIF